MGWYRLGAIDSACCTFIARNPPSFPPSSEEKKKIGWIIAAKFFQERYKNDIERKAKKDHIQWYGNSCGIS